MTFCTNSKAVLRLICANFSWLTVLFLGAGLSGCASLERYEPSFAPSQQAAAPPSAAALREAEARGYDEGLIAGKRIQARHDRATDQEEAAKASAAASQAASPVAQEAVQEAPALQAVRTTCETPTLHAAQVNAGVTPAGTTVAPVAGNTQATADRASRPQDTGPNAFAASGPARPLSTPVDPF